MSDQEFFKNDDPPYLVKTFDSYGINIINSYTDVDLLGKKINSSPLVQFYNSFTKAIFDYSNTESENDLEYISILLHYITAVSMLIKTLTKTNKRLFSIDISENVFRKKSAEAIAEYVTISPTIEIEYETFGDPKNPALSLMEGHGAQMVKWDTEYCKMFADRNLYVIRFDNRDCGLSTKFDGIEVDLGAVLKAALLEETVPPVPYTLSDMAGDVVGLLDF
jgi:hypothetical protein